LGGVPRGGGSGAGWGDRHEGVDKMRRDLREKSGYLDSEHGLR